MSDIYAAVDQLVIADGFRAGPVCDALEVCRSGFDWWRFGRESERAVIDAHSEPEIRDIFWRNHRRYGARRIAVAVALAARGIACGVARVSRFLKKQGLFAIQPPFISAQDDPERARLGLQREPAGRPRAAGRRQPGLGRGHHHLYGWVGVDAVRRRS